MKVPLFDHLCKRLLLVKTLENIDVSGT